MSTLTKVLSDDRIYYFIVIMIMIAAAYSPIAIAVEVPTYVRDYYNIVEGLKPGDTVIVGCWVTTMTTWETDAAGYASFTRMLEKGANIIWWSGSLEAVALDLNTFNEMFGAPFEKSPMYGKRFVYLGYIPGSEDTVHTLGESIRALRKVDYFGTSLDALEATKNVNSAPDMAFAINRIGGGKIPIGFGSTYWLPYKVPVGVIGDAGYISYIIEYTAGLIQGLLAGARSGYAYERLLGVAGKSSGFTSAMILAGLFQVVGVIGANVIYFSRKGGVKKK